MYGIPPDDTPNTASQQSGGGRYTPASPVGASPAPASPAPANTPRSPYVDAALAIMGLTQPKATPAAYAPKQPMTKQTGASDAFAAGASGMQNKMKGK